MSLGVAVAVAAAAALLAGGASGESRGSLPPQPSSRCGPPGRHATTFMFTTADHVRLDGALVGAGRRGVLLVHEAGVRGLCGWWPYGVRLASRGFRVLLFDLRCYGLSTCPQRGSNVVANDIRSAAQELSRRGATSIELVGASFGGSAALVAAAQDRRISAVADLSGDENATPVSEQKPATALTAAKNVHQPALIAVARNDGYISVAEARRVYDSLGSRTKRLVLLPATAGHGWDMLSSTSGGWTALERTLTAFLRAHARPPLR